MKVLSIIVPTYNMEKYLDRCLSSLIVSSKNLDYLEVLVVNDGSTDNSSFIARTYSEKYPSVFYIIDKENGNYGSCINKGVSVANGKYIKILDADDWFITSSLDGLISFLLGCNSDLVITDCKTLRKESEGNTTFRLLENKEFPISQIDRDTCRQIFMHSITYMTSIIREIKYEQTEGISYTDLEWAYYPMSNVKTVSYYSQIVYCYNLSREGQTVDQEQHAKNLWMEIKIIDKMIKHYQSTNRKDKLSQYLYNRLYEYIHKVYDYYLLDMPHTLDNKDLYRFDSSLKNLFPKMYEELSNEILSRKLIPRFKYIENWRETKRRSSIWFKIYDINKLVVELFHY